MQGGVERQWKRGIEIDEEELPVAFRGENDEMNRDLAEVSDKYLNNRKWIPLRGYYMTEVLMYKESICDVKWGTYVLLGLLSLIFGIVIFMYPGLTAAVLVMFFGVLVIVLAFMALVMALMSPGTTASPTWLLLGAILGFIVGVGAILAPQFFGAILTIIIAVVLFMIGLMNVIIALSEKTFPHRWVLFFMGLLSVIFAILLMVYPLIGSFILFGVLIGIYFIFYGILSIIAGFSLRSVKNEYCKA
jgi:uncharacterized membrane protein HdeD (DUF308 family)